MYDTRRDSQRIESKDVRSLSRIHFLRFTRYSWPFVTHPCKIFFEEGGYPVSIHCVISASTDARGSKNDFFSLSLFFFFSPFFFHVGYFARASDLPSVTLDSTIFRIKCRSSLLLATRLMAEVPLT